MFLLRGMNEDEDVLLQTTVCHLGEVVSWVVLSKGAPRSTTQEGTCPSRRHSVPTELCRTQQ